MTTAHRCRTILMVGPDETARGGIAAVVTGYIRAGLFDRFQVTYIRTHRDVSIIGKIWVALRALGAYLRCLLRFQEPLIHIHVSSRASFWRKLPFCLIARLFNRPYLLHLHGGEFMQFYEHELGPAGRSLVRNAFRNAQLVIGLSEQWRESILRIVPGQNVIVLPNAVAVPAQPSVRGSTADARILCLGKIKQRKGTYDLIQAFSRIATKFPAATLICAGDGEVDAAREMAAGLKLSSRVECPGWLNSDGVREQLAAATIFVLPSYAEGFPMALLEAMSWALPVVSTPVGGIPRVIVHGENGMLTEPGDVESLAAVLDALLANPELRDRLGARARQTIVNEYSIDIVVRTLESVYRRFYEPGSPAAQTE